MTGVTVFSPTHGCKNLTQNSVLLKDEELYNRFVVKEGTMNFTPSSNFYAKMIYKVQGKCGTFMIFIYKDTLLFFSKTF